MADRSHHHRHRAARVARAASTSRSPPEEIQRSLEIQARKLGREMKVPGFRTGKIPPAVVIQRIGREPILDEAVRGRLTDWYMKAVDESGIAPVGDPEVDLGKLPDEGKPLTFSFEVGVRPSATLGAYRGLEVVRREPAADPEAVHDQIDEMRERMARLEVVDRPPQNGDFVILDFVGTIDGEPFEGGEGRDQLVEVGAGRLIPGFEEGLVGVARGRDEDRRRDVPRRLRRQARRRQAGAVRVHASRRSSTRTSPTLDDEFASDAAGYDTLDELRESIAKELLEHDVQQRRGRVPRRRAGRRRRRGDGRRSRARSSRRARRSCWTGCCTRSATRASPRTPTCRSPARPRTSSIEESKPDAEIALRREAVLAAVIEAEQIEPTEEQLLDALEDAADTRADVAPEAARPPAPGRPRRHARQGGRRRAGDRPRRDDRQAGRARRRPTRSQAKAAEEAPLRRRRPAAKKKPPAKKQGDKARASCGRPTTIPQPEKGKLWTPDS